MQCNFFCVYRPYKESISKEMNNDNDLNLHLHDQIVGLASLLVKISVRNRNIIYQIYTKIANIAKLYIFQNLQHFSTKLCNFTNLPMFFLDAVTDFYFSLNRLKFSLLCTT